MRPFLLMSLLLTACATAQPEPTGPQAPARDDDSLLATYQQDQQSSLDLLEHPGNTRDCARDCQLSGQICTYPPKCFALGHENEERYTHACVELSERCTKANEDVVSHGCVCDSH